MSLKLLNLSSMYPGYLASFYRKFPDSKKLSYRDHYKLLMEDTTEFAGSYTRNFIKLGINAECVISNDNFLQSKWRSENQFNSEKNGDILFEQVAAFKPDILWIEDLNYINNEWLNGIRNKIKSVKLIIAYHCAYYNNALLEKLKNVDFVVTCTPGLKQSFEKEGVRAYLIYHGFDNDLLARIKPKQELPSVRLVFSGSLVTGDSYHNSRIKLIESLIELKIDLSLYVTLEKGYRIAAKRLIHFIFGFLKKLNLEKLTHRFPFFEYGRSPVINYSKELLRSNHSPLYGIDMYNLFNKSGIVLNIHTGAAGEYAGNMRIFEVTGVGSCLLTDNKINMKDLFDEGTEVLVYNDTDDCIQKVKWLLEHEKEREKIAKAGQKKTLEFHNVENRCRTIIDIITKELNGR
jgi:spore maturation protein CgeB